MSRYTGRQGRGAARRAREQRRREAQARNRLTAPRRRRAARRPCPTGKVKLADEHAAQVALVSAVLARNRGRNQRHETAWYECRHCGHLHLTSQSYEKRRWWRSLLSRRPKKPKEAAA